MRVRTQEGTWTDLHWWGQLAARGTSVVVTSEDETLVIADLATTEECDLLFREMNRRIRMDIPTLDVTTYLAAIGALTDLFTDDPTTQKEAHP